jgi:septum formation protein
MKAVILASQSPRRKELLSQMGVDYDIVPSNFDEQLDNNRSPEAVAIELATGKAREVAARYLDSVVIGSDTIVTVNGEQLAKPHDRQDAHDMLKKLSGTSNDVTTGVAVIRLSDGIELTGTANTKVVFKPYDQAAVDRYLDTGDYADKAGGYGIQSGAAPLIDHIEGPYDTVVGFPTQLVAELLQQVGISARPVELPSPVKQIL